MLLKRHDGGRGNGLDYDELFDQELPPLAGDETDDGQAIELDRFDDEEDPGWLDEGDAAAVDLDEISRQIASDDGDEEGSWTGDGDVDVDMEGLISSDEEEEGWSDEEAESDDVDWIGDLIQDDGADNEDSDDPAGDSDDAGLWEDESMPLDELDASGDDDEAPEEVDDALLDELVSAITDGSGSLPGRRIDLLPAQFLGPWGFHAAGGCAYEGRVVIVGEGVFTRGADGRLHISAGTSWIADYEPQSVILDPQNPGSIFIGTLKGGGLWSDDGGLNFEHMDGWLKRGGMNQTLPDALYLASSILPGEPFLWGMDGSGGVYFSRDRGFSWDGPVLSFNARAFASDSSAGGSVTVCGLDGVKPVLFLSDTEGAWRMEEIPEPFFISPAGERPVIAANADVIIAGGPDMGTGYMLTTDRSRTWRFLQEPAGITAALVHPLNNRVIFAACYDGSGDASEVIMSMDRGAEWKTVFDMDAAMHEHGIGVINRKLSDRKIGHMFMDTASPDTLWIVSGLGVFLLTDIYY